MGIKFNPLIFSGLDMSGSSGGGGGANTTLSNLTSPTAINQDFIFAVGKVIQGSGTPFINPNTQTIYDSASHPLIQLNSTNSYGFPALFNNTGKAVLDWVNLSLNDTSENTSVDWQNRQLFDNGFDLIMDWNLGILYDGFGAASVRFEDRTLIYGNNALSIDWNNSKLYGTTGVVTVGWDQNILKDNANKQSIDWGGRNLNDNAGNLTASWLSGGAKSALFAVQNFGHSNTSAATTPGSVVKKMEIFDASGNSLGFIPIYNSIT